MRQKENSMVPVDGKNISRMARDQTREGRNEKQMERRKDGIRWVCTVCAKLKTLGRCQYSYIMQFVVSLVKSIGQSPYALISDLCRFLCKKCYFIIYCPFSAVCLTKNYCNILIAYKLIDLSSCTEYFYFITV